MLTPTRLALCVAGFSACLLPSAALANSLAALACAAGVHCSGAVNAQEAQIALGMSQPEAQLAFVDASRDWDDAVWNCAAGGGTCGALNQRDAQMAIGLPGEAYGPAVQLREQPPSAAQPPATTPRPRTPTPSVAKAPEAPARKPGIVVEKMPPAGPGGYAEVPIPPAGGTGSSADIQPLDGYWMVTGGASQAVGCMAGVAESVGRNLPAPQTGQITFDKPFNARQLLKGNGVTWRRAGADHHVATIAQGGSVMLMSFDLKVRNPSQMLGQAIVTVRIPGQPVCTVTTPFTYQRQSS